MGPEQPQVETRRELFDYLEEQMNRAYRQVLQTARLERESTYVKTYMLEFDWNSDGGASSEAEFLSSALTVPPAGGAHECAPAVIETKERGFFIVDWQRPSGPLRLYLDTTSDPHRRFWLAYSLSDAARTDILLDQLARARPRLDRVWLWPDLLRAVQAKGEFRGFGLDYDYRRFEAKEGKRDSTDYFKAQFWGGAETEQVLDFIEGKFRKKTVIGKVRMKYWDPENGDQDFSLEDIKYNGKFTTRGTSFGTHQVLVSWLRDRYEETIQRIEQAHVTRTTPRADGGSPEGDPIYFVFDEGQQIPNLDVFCEVVFSGHLPFRLWGIPRATAAGDDGRLVSAVDLHTGSKLSFEIYQDMMCMYLHQGACGNTAARFFTNIQHAFSRLVRAEDNEGHIVFQSGHD